MYKLLRYLRVIALQLTLDSCLSAYYAEMYIASVMESEKMKFSLLFPSSSS